MSSLSETQDENVKVSLKFAWWVWLLIALGGLFSFIILVLIIRGITKVLAPKSQHYHYYRKSR